MELGLQRDYLLGQHRSDVTRQRRRAAITAEVLLLRHAFSSLQRHKRRRISGSPKCLAQVLAFGAESAVEPTRSENITVTWRRSAVLEIRFFVLGLRWWSWTVG
jgi:hypothetical protein